MKVIKVLNNNTVSSIIDGSQVILQGSGIGFNVKAGDEVNQNKIEKTYYIHDDNQQRFLKLLSNANKNVIKASEYILDLASKDDLKVDDQILIALIDHLDFALERYKKDISLPYLMLAETKVLYPKEYQIGLKGLDYLKELTNCKLPDYEAGYIALHLASFQNSKKEAIDTLKFVSECIKIIEDSLHIKIDEDSLDSVRLMTHLKFLANAIISKKEFKGEDLSSFYNLLLDNNPKRINCLQRLNEYIENTFNYQLSQADKVYLLVHINKITSN